MADKGSRRSAAADARAAQLVSDLLPLGEVRSRPMFGGFGIFAEDTMFALVDSQGTAFVRADGDLAARLEADGSERHGRMPYWSIPASVAAEPDELIGLAEDALRVAKGPVD